MTTTTIMIDIELDDGTMIPDCLVEAEADGGRRTRDPQEEMDGEVGDISIEDDSGNEVEWDDVKNQGEVIEELINSAPSHDDIVRDEKAYWDEIKEEERRIDFDI